MSDGEEVRTKKKRKKKEKKRERKREKKINSYVIYQKLVK